MQDIANPKKRYFCCSLCGLIQQTGKSFPSVWLETTRKRKFPCERRDFCSARETEFFLKPVGWLGRGGVFFFFFENAARWFWVPEFMVILQMIGKYIQMCISCGSSGNADLGGSPRHFTKGLWAPIMQVNNWLKISQLGIIGYYWVLLSIIWVLLRIIWVLLFCFFLLFLILWGFFFQLKGETICWLKMQCLNIH